MNILFVCLGNICRSPIADGIMRQLVAQQGLDWTIDSAGTGRWHVGKAPDARAIAVAKRNGVDISILRARQFTADDFTRFDKIYTMDLQNQQDVLALARNEDERAKVELFLKAAFPDTHKGVRDPWHDDELFKPVYQEVSEACETLLNRLLDES